VKLSPGNLLEIIPADLLDTVKLYQLKSGDVVRLGSKDWYGTCVGGRRNCV